MIFISLEDAGQVFRNLELKTISTISGSSICKTNGKKLNHQERFLMCVANTHQQFFQTICLSTEAKTTLKLYLISAF